MARIALELGVGEGALLVDRPLLAVAMGEADLAAEPAFVPAPDRLEGAALDQP
jgi:hypothetical protein